MTEDEAKTKWCPFVRMSPQSAINNRGDNHPNAGNVKCIGSDCMAWQWNQGKDNVRQYVDDNGLLIVESGREGMGYCGLASRRADHERL